MNSHKKMSILRLNACSEIGLKKFNVVPQNERTRFLFLKSYARPISVPDCVKIALIVEGIQRRGRNKVYLLFLFTIFMSV